MKHIVISRTDFEAIVAQAWASLPQEFRERACNVSIVVEEWPDARILQRLGLTRPAALLGFYHGVPQVRRTHHYGMVLPDKISIYRQPILLRCRSVEEVQALVNRVLRHELAHHFGISDDRLRDLGAY